MLKIFCDGCSKDLEMRVEDTSKEENFIPKSGVVILRKETRVSRMSELPWAWGPHGYSGEVEEVKVSKYLCRDCEYEFDSWLTKRKNENEEKEKKKKEFEAGKRFLLYVLENSENYTLFSVHETLKQAQTALEVLHKEYESKGRNDLFLTRIISGNVNKEYENSFKFTFSCLVGEDNYYYHGQISKCYVAYKRKKGTTRWKMHGNFPFLTEKVAKENIYETSVFLIDANNYEFIVQEQRFGKFDVAGPQSIPLTISDTEKNMKNMKWKFDGEKRKFV